jgi:hypothetical protein
MEDEVMAIQPPRGLRAMGWIRFVRVRRAMGCATVSEFVNVRELKKTTDGIAVRRKTSEHALDLGERSEGCDGMFGKQNLQRCLVFKVDT